MLLAYGSETIPWNRGIIRNAPAAGLPPELRADLSEKVVEATEAIRYVGTEAMGFIFGDDANKFYFMRGE